MTSGWRERAASCMPTDAPRSVPSCRGRQQMSGLGPRASQLATRTPSLRELPYCDASKRPSSRRNRHLQHVRRSGPCIEKRRFTVTSDTPTLRMSGRRAADRASVKPPRLVGVTVHLLDSEDRGGRDPEVALAIAFERNLRSPIPVQQAVGFLVGVSELRIAEAGQQPELSAPLRAAARSARQSLPAWRRRCSPRCPSPGARARSPRTPSASRADRRAAPSSTSTRPPGRSRLNRCGSTSCAWYRRAMRSGIVVVVVDADDVGRDAFPSVVANDGPGRIQRLGEMVKRLDVVTLAGIVRKIRDAPRLVDRHPRDDAGMAGVALNDGSPFARQLAAPTAS